MPKKVIPKLRDFSFFLNGTFIYEPILNENLCECKDLKFISYTFIYKKNMWKVLRVRTTNEKLPQRSRMVTFKSQLFLNTSFVHNIMSVANLQEIIFDLKGH